MTDPDLHDLNPDDHDPLRDLVRQFVGHHVGGTAQRGAVSGGVIVGMGGRDVPQRRLGLHATKWS